MRNWRTTLLGNERGVALVLALMMLLALTGLLLAFLSVSSLEPQISRNLADTARARYLAEAGLEVGFATLVNTGDAMQSFTPAVASGTSGAPWVTLVNNGTIANVTSGGSAAEAAFAGTFTVIVRNDSQTADSALTGQAAGANAVPAETDSADSNKIVIMRSSGTFNGATKTIEVVVRRAPLPPFPGAVNLPGLQTDTFVNKTTFDIDGRDYRCTADCDTASNWVETGAATVANKWSIASQTGTQSNIGTSYENNIQNAVSSSASKMASLKGRNETVACPACATSYTTGLNTIQADNSLNPDNMQAFLDAVANFPGTTILQSTQTCPMQMTGASTPTNQVTVSNGCSGASGVNKTVDLGTRDNPKLVYFRGDTDPSSAFTGLTLNSGIKGAGILIIEDGDLKNLGSLTWDGVVIVAGNYVGSGFMSGSNTQIRGAFVAFEKMQGEASGFFEFYLHGSLSSFSVRASKQNLDMVQLARGATAMTNYREL
jgi:Tfp pilus assembly protein PilX